ncbi:MAG: hypothetical protein ACLR6Y_14060 [Roseburia faecis]
MIAGRETGNNGILKCWRCRSAAAHYPLPNSVCLPFMFMEMVVFLVVFVIAGLIATQTMGVTETLPILYLLKWCLGLFLTMLPCIAAMWTILCCLKNRFFHGINLLLVIPGVLVANTPLWITYRTVTAVISFPALSMILQKLPTPLFGVSVHRARCSVWPVSRWLSPNLGKRNEVKL